MKPKGLFLPPRALIERRDPQDESEMVHRGVLGRLRNMPVLAKVLNVAVAVGFAPNVIETSPVEVQMWTSKKDHYESSVDHEHGSS